jgi:hypothetical protein
MTRNTRRDVLHLSLAGGIVAGLSPQARSLPSATASREPVTTRMFWTWDHSTEWALNLPGAQTQGAANNYSRAIGFSDHTTPFLRDYSELLGWAGRHGIDAVVIWGLLRDLHGGIESAQRLCETAAKNRVRILCGVGLNAYGGVYYDGESPYSLERHLAKNPELVAFDAQGKPLCEPHLCRACPSRRKNQEYAAESLRWLFKAVPQLGGVQMETGDFGVCQCKLCRKRREHPSSGFSWEDMALMYPIAADAIRSVSPQAWIVCETYSNPEPYRGARPAPDFGDGKAAWAEPCIASFPKGETIFVQWLCDNYVKPKLAQRWTEAGTVTNTERRNIMRAHFSTFWAGRRGELAVDWIADMARRSMSHGFDAMSLFGEVSPFHTGAELNYLALANYGSAANPQADLDVFLRDVAGRLLGGEKLARDYLRYARLVDRPAEIPAALPQMYANCAKNPITVARRWAWLANYLASFVESTDPSLGL